MSVIDFDQAVECVAKWMARQEVRPVKVSDYNEAKRILWGLLPLEEQTRRVMR